MSEAFQIIFNGTNVGNCISTGRDPVIDFSTSSQISQEPINGSKWSKLISENSMTDTWAIQVEMPDTAQHQMVSQYLEWRETYGDEEVEVVLRQTIDSIDYDVELGTCRCIDVRLILPIVGIFKGGALFTFLHSNGGKDVINPIKNDRFLVGVQNFPWQAVDWSSAQYSAAGFAEDDSWSRAYRKIGEPFMLATVVTPGQSVTLISSYVSLKSTASTGDVLKAYADIIPIEGRRDYYDGSDAWESDDGDRDMEGRVILSIQDDALNKVDDYYSITKNSPAPNRVMTACYITEGRTYRMYIRCEARADAGSKLFLGVTRAWFETEKYDG